MNDMSLPFPSLRMEISIHFLSFLLWWLPNNWHLIVTDPLSWPDVPSVVTSKINKTCNKAWNPPEIKLLAHFTEQILKMVSLNNTFDNSVFWQQLPPKYLSQLGQDTKRSRSKDAQYRSIEVQKWGLGQIQLSGILALDSVDDKLLNDYLRL